MTCWRAAKGLPACVGEEPVVLDIPCRLQDSDHDCGAACVAAVALFFGLRPRGRALANPAQGMAPDTVEALLRSLGLAVLSGTMGVDDLRHLTRTGRPVLCPVTVPAGGHWVVVCGVERNRVHYHCPTDGRKVKSVAEWDADWRDTARTGEAFDRWGIAAGPTR